MEILKYFFEKIALASDFIYTVFNFYGFPAESREKYSIKGKVFRLHYICIF